MYHKFIETKNKSARVTIDGMYSHESTEHQKRASFQATMLTWTYAAIQLSYVTGCLAVQS